MRAHRPAGAVSRSLAFFVVVALAACAALLASSASALDIDTEVSLPDGEVGMPYEFQFSGEEGCQPYNFSFLTGQLPPGLTVQRDGLMNGTPTASGTFTFWVELTDGVPGGACHSPTPSQGEYSVVIAPKVEITKELHGAKVGVPFNTTVTATGGGSLQWAVVEGALPPGLSLNRDTGALTGVPSTVGTYPFAVKVSDDKRRDTRLYTFVVAAPLAIEPSVSFARVEVGVAVSVTIPSTGGIGPLAWAVAEGGALPAGLSLDPATGAVKGTPTTSGRASVGVTVTDSDGQTVQTTVNVSVAPRLSVAKTRVPAGRVGKSYRTRLIASGGVGPFSWHTSAGALPRGLALDGSTGVISGTPRAAGTFRVTVRSTDKLGVVATRSLTITVVPRRS